MSALPTLVASRIFASMRIRTTAFVLACSLCVAGGASSSASNGTAAPARVATKPACIAVKTWTRVNVPGYDHMVTLTSTCKKDATCTVSTDVNPEAQVVKVAKGESVDVLTFRASPASEFVAKVDCTGGASAP